MLVIQLQQITFLQQERLQIILPLQGTYNQRESNLRTLILMVQEEEMMKLWQEEPSLM